MATETDARDLLSRIKIAANKQADTSIPQGYKQKYNKRSFANLQEDAYNNAIYKCDYEGIDFTDNYALSYIVNQATKDLMMATSYLHATPDDIDEIMFMNKEPRGVYIHIADAIIKLMILAEYHNVDLEQIIQLKNQFNKES